MRCDATMEDDGEEADSLGRLLIDYCCQSTMPGRCIAPDRKQSGRCNSQFSQYAKVAVEAADATTGRMIDDLYARYLHSQILDGGGGGWKVGGVGGVG